jgi:hypothetical protein
MELVRTRNRIEPLAVAESPGQPGVAVQEILQRATTIIERARQDEAYADPARDQCTKAWAIRSHDRRRLSSSASAAAARRFTGIAARSASTA